MTQLVDRLQGAGLLDRVPDPADGRVVQVRITCEGRELLARRQAVRAERVAGLLARLSPGDQALLTAALPASYGRTVRVRGDEVLVFDGPFAETKEQIGGFDVLECASLDEAIEVAGKHPVARFGAIDVRPFWQE
jgi:hypothetical protein